MDDCLFCKIAAGELPATVVERTEDVIAIRDVNPQAPSHVLVMPVAHHATIADLLDKDVALATRVMETASALGRRAGAANGFRLVVNTGSDGGQTVDHVHVHVLAGRHMSWPPG
jgi:histidine triad (HIT) family protein